MQAAAPEPHRVAHPHTGESSMADDTPPRLSDLIGEGSPVSTDRRSFLARASALSLAIPGLGAAALSACRPADSGRDTTHTSSRPSSAPATVSSTDSLHHRNSDSRLDSAMLKGAPHGNSSATPGATSGATSTAFHRYDPTLPPAPDDGRLHLHWHAREVPVRISADTVVAGSTPLRVFNRRHAATVFVVRRGAGARDRIGGPINRAGGTGPGIRFRRNSLRAVVRG